MHSCFSPVPCPFLEKIGKSLLWLIWYRRKTLKSHHQCSKQVIRRIVKGNYQFISRRWKTVSTAAKSFVVRLLQDKPERRPSATEALADPWLFKGDFDTQGFAPGTTSTVCALLLHGHLSGSLLLTPCHFLILKRWR